jgi:hypothetical protein
MRKRNPGYDTEAEVGTEMMRKGDPLGRPQSAPRMLREGGAMPRPYAGVAKRLT